MHHVDYIDCQAGKVRLRRDKLSTLKATKLSTVVCEILSTVCTDATAPYQNNTPL